MENISPEEVVKILKEHGTTVTVEEAKLILAFMFELANISLDQYFSK